jgi:hypothetical protein
MTSIDKFTIEDFDNENSNYIGGGDDILVHDIEKEFNMSGGSNNSINVERNLEDLDIVGGDDGALEVGPLDDISQANANRTIDPDAIANLNRLVNNEGNVETNESVDPEAELSSAESVDPEAELSNAESVDPEAELSNAESVDPEAELSNAENNNTSQVENPDPYGDLPEDEFIIDDEDFVIQEIKSKIKIFEEEIIPEHKVIANENDQAEDLINEAIRLLPEKLRENKYELKKIYGLLKNLQELKETYSIKDKKDLFKLKPKLKGKYFVKHIEEILSGDFSNNYIVPIVDAKNKLYYGSDTKDKDLLKSIIQKEDLELIPDANFDSKDNSEEILKSLELREKFRKGKSRINYSFKNELTIINNNNTQYKAKKNNLNIKPNKNTFVFRDCFTQDCFYYNKKKLDTKEFDKFLVHSDYHNFTDTEGPLLQGDYMDINGFIRLPRNNLKLKRLNIDTLQNVCNNSYSFNDLYNNISNNSIEHINFNIEPGKKVKLCFSIDNDKTNIDGIIENVDETTIYVKPLDLGDDLPNETLEIQKNDKNVSVLNVENGDRQCVNENENEYKIFLFDDEEIVNKKILTKYLKNIIPNTNDVIYSLKEQFQKDSNKSLDNLLEYVSFYNLKLEDFSFENFKELIQILYNHNHDLSIQADEDEKNYLKFLKALPQEIRKNVLFINNKSLNDLKKYYGEYPFFGKSIDNASSRLNWITSQQDNGMLYFKTIVKGITEKMKFDPQKMAENYEKKLYKLRNTLDIIQGEIEREKQGLVSDKNKCLEYRIVKKYTLLQQLEADNETDVEIDKDKLIYGEGTNLVQPDQYCLLDENSELKIFKRVKLANEKDIWTIEPTLNVSQIMQTNTDFCEQQLKNLEDVESSMFNSKSCKFSSFENNCITAELDKKIQKREALKEKITSTEESLTELRNTTDFTENIEANLEVYRNYLLLYNDLSFRKFKNYELNLDDFQEEEVDEKYQELYKKINLYMEKISKFADHKRYMLLDNLIQKYGREYNSANIKKESEHNIYCKYGNKILCCKHDLKIIEMFKNPEEYDTRMESLIETYGIENEGSQWCKHCGREIYIADYETIEGFKKSGARDVTSELVEDESYNSKYENTELFESLKKYLDEDSKDTNTLSVFNVIKAFLNITGVKLNDSDEMRIMTETTNLCKTNIKPKTEWMQTYSGKPKKADKYYENYREVNTIFLTVSMLFITMQISIPEYTILKSHAKCVVSLDGFPLNNSNKKGIKYFSCILETLRDSSSNFECLKKIKLEEVLEKTITKLVNDDYYETKLKEKNEYLLELKKKKLLKKRKNVWNEFKPSLEPFDIENNVFDKLLLQDLSKKKNKDELNLYYSLKIISKIDSIINDSSIENYLFNPTPLGNSCCIQSVNNNFNYYDYFNEYDSIQKLIEQSQSLDNNYFINDKTQISTNIYNYEKLPTFKNKIYPDEDNITQEQISKIYETFITKEYPMHAGKKHAYENNICLITGEKRENITQKTYTNEEYYDILNTINNKNSINVNFVENNIDNLVIIQDLLARNTILNNDSYITQFFNILLETKDKVKIDELWDDFDKQVKVELSELVSSFDGILDKPSMKKITYILTNIGDLNDIYEERKEVNEIEANKLFFEQKCALIKRFSKFIFNMFSKIKYESISEVVDINQIPKNWKIEKSYYDNLMINIKKDNELVEKNIITKRSKELNIVFANLNELISNFKEILNVSGQEHLYNCDGSVNRYSKFTNKNCSAFLKYNFINIIKNLFSLQNSLEDEIILLKSKPQPTFSETSVEVEVSPEFSSPTSSSTKPELVGEDPSSADIQQKIFVLENTKTDAQKFVAKLINDLLLIIESNQAFYNKHTQKHLTEVIEKTMDIEKEENLKFIEELDKESRQSLKSMITIGFDTWKNLSKKSEKELYFGENIEEEVSRENEDLSVAPNEEETELINRNAAAQALGEEYTDEQYREFLEQRDENAREERQILNDMEVMRDDDGDGDFGAEDEEEY